MMMRGLVVTLLLIIVSGSTVQGSTEFTFVPDVRFDDPSRWGDGDHGVPCAEDRIIFPPDDVVSVFVQGGSKITEMVLPLNGEFIFGDGSIWGSSNDLSSCSHDGESHDLEFNPSSDDWLNPINWRATDEGRDMLDFEKVPCDFDVAVFPGISSFTAEIRLNGVIRNLQIAERTFTTSTFTNYRKNEGRYKFIGAGEIVIDKSGCTDPSGCICRDQDDSMQDVFHKICNYVTCGGAECENPIIAYGSCCYQCGSAITFNYTDEYTESKMTEFLDTFSAQPQYSAVHVVLSKVNTQMMLSEDSRASVMLRNQDYLAERDVIQIYITDESGTGDDAKQLANEIYEEINSPNNDLGVSVSTMQSSGSAKSQALGAAAVAGIVIGLIFGIVLLTILFYAGVRRSRSRVDFQLDDSRASSYQLPHITEVGPGQEFESSDHGPKPKKSQARTVPTENIGWPQMSALDSDFGGSFGNPAFVGDDL